MEDVMKTPGQLGIEAAKADVRRQAVIDAWTPTAEKLFQSLLKDRQEATKAILETATDQIIEMLNEYAQDQDANDLWQAYVDYTEPQEVAENIEQLQD
jgi:hypothetical protein